MFHHSVLIHWYVERVSLNFTGNYVMWPHLIDWDEPDYTDELIEQDDLAVDDEDS